MPKKDSRLSRAGVSGYNKPKKTPKHPTKSHVVVAKQGEKVKTIRFGQQGVSGSPLEKMKAKLIPLDAHRSKQDTPRILPKVKCQRLTGLIR